MVMKNNDAPLVIFPKVQPENINPRLTFMDEIGVGMDIVRETIKKYNIFEPERNVVVMWIDGKLAIAFSHEVYENWSVSDK